MKNESKKCLRLLKIWEMLNADSDEDHPIGTEELRRRLAEFGLDCDRRTLYSDIESLQEAGYEIFCIRSRSNQYYVVDRKFSLPEILIVMDAVQASSFISEKKTAELVSKVGALAGSRKGEVLQKNVVQFSTVKCKNEGVYYAVNEICQAITAKKQLGFNYFDYDLRFNRAYRHDKTDPTKIKYYVVNPIATVFSNDNYYMFCYDDKHANVAQYRVDRMANVSVLSSDITPNPDVENSDISAYKKQLFTMFGGEETEVEFEIKTDNDVLDVIHDKFGDGVKLFAKDYDTATFKTTVRVSPTFIAWCISFGNKIKLVSPKKTVQKVKNYLKEVSAQYKV